MAFISSRLVLPGGSAAPFRPIAVNSQPRELGDICRKIHDERQITRGAVTYSLTEVSRDLFGVVYSVDGFAFPAVAKVGYPKNDDLRHEKKVCSATLAFIKKQATACSEAGLPVAAIINNPAEEGYSLQARVEGGSLPVSEEALKPLIPGLRRFIDQAVHSGFDLKFQRESFLVKEGVPTLIAFMEEPREPDELVLDLYEFIQALPGDGTMARLLIEGIKGTWTYNRLVARLPHLLAEELSASLPSPQTASPSLHSSGSAE